MEVAVKDRRASKIAAELKSLRKLMTHKDLALLCSKEQYACDKSCVTYMLYTWEGEAFVC